MISSSIKEVWFHHQHQHIIQHLFYSHHHHCSFSIHHQKRRIHHQKRRIHQYKSQIFRKVHPDLFANETINIKNKNLKCMQSLNEFFETFSNASNHYLKKKECSFLSTRFHPVYDFSCYIHDTSTTTNNTNTTTTNTNTNLVHPIVKDDYRTTNRATTNTTADNNNKDDSNNNNRDGDTIKKKVKKLHFISFSLHPPKGLLRNNSNDDDEKSKYQITRALNILKNDFNQFILSLGIIDCGDHDVVKEAGKNTNSSNNNNNNNHTTTTTNSRLRNNNNQHSRSSISNAEDILNELAFERIMINSYNYSSQSMFSSSSSSSLSMKSKNTNHMIMEEIDSYIQNGLIYVKHMSVQQEFETLDKFRQFILDFGDLICFSSNNWKNLIFIFNGDDFIEVETADPITSSTSSSSSSNSNNNNNNDSSNSINSNSSASSHNNSSHTSNNNTSTTPIPDNKVYKKPIYSCKHQNNMYILQIPINFKPKKLVMLLSEHVEQISKFH